MGEGAPVLARRDNVLRQVAALEVNINRSRSRSSKGTVRAQGKEMGPKKGKDGGGGKGDKGRHTIGFLQQMQWYCTIQDHTTMDA